MPSAAVDDVVDGLDPARRRVLRALAGQDAGVPVARLAQVLGGHPNTARHHLRALVAAGLVRADAEVATSRGRPAVRYTVTAAGRRAATATGGSTADRSAGEYLALATAFADRLAEQGHDPSQDARAVGAAWGAALVGREVAEDRAAEDRAAAEGTGAVGPRARLLDLLDRLGFSPESSAPPGAGGKVEVRLRTCPLLDAARRHPEVVCQVHAGLVSGADRAYGGSGEGVALTPFARPGACLLTLPPAR